MSLLCTNLHHILPAGMVEVFLSGIMDSKPYLTTKYNNGEIKNKRLCNLPNIFNFTFVDDRVCLVIKKTILKI